jgi:branched-chain amino acid transport system permease protein
MDARRADGMTDFAIFAVTMIAIWSVLGISLHLQFGLTGLVNFGQVLPFAVGAYGAGFAAVHGLPEWAGVVLGAVFAPLLGVLVILPAGRLTQDYWALVTLGAGEIFRLTMLNASAIAGGVEGTSVYRIDSNLAAMAFALVLLTATILFARRVGRSPFGRMLRVLREDELLAATLGRDPVQFQRAVTMISWCMAALAGALYAHVVGYISPSAFTVVETFVIWTAVVLGGPATIAGVVLGTAIVQLTSVSTRFIADWSHLEPELVANLRLGAFGLVLVLVFLFRPEGLIPERRERVNAGGG